MYRYKEWQENHFRFRSLRYVFVNTKQVMYASKHNQNTQIEEAEEHLLWMFSCSNVQHLHKHLQLHTCYLTVHIIANGYHI